MNRRIKALLLLPMAITALASWSVIEQPIGQSAWTAEDAQQHLAVAPDTPPAVAPSSDSPTTTAGLVVLAGIALDAAGVVEFGAIGGAVGAVAAGVAEVGGALGWFSAAFAGALGSAAVITMGAAG